MPQPAALSALNSADQATFVAHLGRIFEHSPWVAAETWSARPFASRATLHQAMVATVACADPQRQLTLICAHPDLVGRAALAGTLTAQSTQEQAAAGLGQLSPEEIARFQQLNAAYRERFDFPFVICARENKKQAILAGFAARLPNSREQEIATALAEIAKIAHYRLLDVVTEQ